MRFTEVFFIAFAIVVIEAAWNDYCDQCSERYRCEIMNMYDLQQQELWLTKYQCPNPFYDGNNRLYNYIHNKGRDFVCCSKILWEIKNNMHRIANDFQDKHFTYPQEIDIFQPSNHQSYKQAPESKDDSRTLAQNQPYFNYNSMPQGGNFPSVTNNAPPLGIEQNVGTKQCIATIFPPRPETECCGREATDAGRIIGSQNSPLINDVISFPNSRMNEYNMYPPQLNNKLSPSKSRQPRSSRYRSRRGISEKNVNITIGQRIAGGKATEFEQYPWTVLLRITFNLGNRLESFNCGGALISSKYVLTAAHCMHNVNGTFTNVEIYLAEYDKQTFPTDCKNVFGVGQKCIENLLMYGESVIIHSQFEPKRLTNDIALIRLRGNAPYTDYIRPICILPMNVDSPEYSNLPLEVAGWGRNGPYRSDIKQSTVVNLVPQEQCKNYYPGLFTKHLCAVGHTGEDTCKGDSGGPLMTVYGGKYFVVGLVSGKRADYACGTSIPSLYTNVYHYYDWILSNIKN